MPEELTDIVPKKRNPWRRPGRSLLVLLLIVVALPAVLYIPGVVNRVGQWILPQVSESVGMRISVDNIELKFPLQLRVDNLLILDSSKLPVDTMIATRRVDLHVSPIALLRGKLEADNVRVSDGLYRTGGIDSLYISARIDTAMLSFAASMDFMKLEVNSPVINGARVDVIMGTEVAEKDSAATSAMELLLRDVRLSNMIYSMYMGTGNDTVYAHIHRGQLADGKILAADMVSISSSRIDLVVDSAMYGSRGVCPQPGLDFSHLLLRGVKVGMDSFQMRGTDLTIPIRHLNVDDIAGLSLEASGTYAMTDKALFAREFDLLINDDSELRVSAMMGLGSAVDAPLELDLSARMMPGVVESAFPSVGSFLTLLPRHIPMDLRTSLSGTMAHLVIDTVAASVPTVFYIESGGIVENMSNPADLNLDLNLRGRVENARSFQRYMPDGVMLPALALRGNIAANGNDYSASLNLTTTSGQLALNGALKGKASDYSIKLSADSLPVAAFVPGLGVGAVTASVSATGHGFDPFAPDAVLDADIDVNTLEYNNYKIQGAAMTANLNDGNFKANLSSKDSALNMDLRLDAILARGEKAIDWAMRGNFGRVDLLALGLSDSILSAAMSAVSTGYVSINADSISADLLLSNVGLNIGNEAYRADSLNFAVRAGQGTMMTLSGNDMRLDFSTNEALSPFVDALSLTAATASDMITERYIYVDSLVNEIPPFELHGYARGASPVQQFFRPSDINFNDFSFNVSKDSVLNIDAYLHKLVNGERNRLDTITAALTTRNNRILLDVNVKNKPGTLDAFASVGMRGMVYGNCGQFFLNQQNIEGQTGYRLGFLATLTDSVVGLQFTPYNPIIAYRNWSINKDNYIALNPLDFHLFSNLDASGGGSRIRLLTSETDSTQSENNVRLIVDDIRLQDWLQINPFAPPVAGCASADMTITYSPKNITGEGTLALDSLTYGRKTVGDFHLGLGLATDFGGSIYANLGLDVNGKRSFMAVGAVNDSIGTSPLNMYMRIKEFPLDIVNPFLPASTAQLSGSLNGQMNIGGSFSAIELDGGLTFNKAKVKVGMMGSEFTLDSINIPVESNMVRFNDYAIYGSNQNPLRVSGSVDLRRFEIPRVDLDLKAKNMQFVDSKKGRGVDLYGKGFVDLAASVKGSMSFLDVNAQLAVLPETNLTYQISDASVAAGLQPDEGVVRFVNFADTVEVLAADSLASTSMQMKLSALLDVRQGSQFTVNLSADGTNRAQVKGQGILNYSTSPIQPEGRLTGRFTIDSGSFRYSLPVISEKLFTFERGSYIAFNGAILSPTLNVTATDQVRANVTRAGENSRLVNFDVILNASGTPERLNVGFDLATADDLSVANELQSMSANQRANQAMNLLLYGVYSGPNSLSSGPNLSSNALYGFLASQLNSWAAKSIKGVDLSFGVDQYGISPDGSNSSTMQYSYKVSKTLFNDRFKIVVGGNYSTDADAEENFAQNLISDVSFEYMINRSGSMYVRLFRKTGFESILEGEVTQTGAGFVVRRKIHRLADIFNFTKAAKQ